MTDDASGRICPFMSRPEWMSGIPGKNEGTWGGFIPCQVECQCWIPYHIPGYDPGDPPEKQFSKTNGYCGMMREE
jgi:hypothetical protein